MKMHAFILAFVLLLGCAEAEKQKLTPEKEMARAMARFPEAVAFPSEPPMLGFSIQTQRRYLELVGKTVAAEIYITDVSLAKDKSVLVSCGVGNGALWQIDVHLSDKSGKVESMVNEKAIRKLSKAIVIFQMTDISTVEFVVRSIVTEKNDEEVRTAIDTNTGGMILRGDILLIEPINS